MTLICSETTVRAVLLNRLLQQIDLDERKDVDSFPRVPEVKDES